MPSLCFPFPLGLHLCAEVGDYVLVQLNPRRQHRSFLGQGLDALYHLLTRTRRRLIADRRYGANFVNLEHGVAESLGRVGEQLQESMYHGAFS